MDHFIDYHQFKTIKTNTKDRLNISLLSSISVAVVIRSKDKETVTVAKIMDAVFMSKNSLKFTLNKIMADFNEKSQNGIKDANIMVFGGDTVTHFRTLLVLYILNSSMNFQAFVGNPLSSKTINSKKNQFLNLIVGRDIKLVKGFVISSDKETIKKVLENGTSPQDLLNKTSSYAYDINLVDEIKTYINEGKMAYSQIGVTEEMLFMLCDINPGEPNREEFLKLVKALNYGHNKERVYNYFSIYEAFYKNEESIDEKKFIEFERKNGIENLNK
jgi:hypothetical protein